MQYTVNYSLNKPQRGVDRANVDKLNENSDTIDELIHQNRTMIAEAYDSSQTEPYAIGDVREFEGRVYRCIAPTSGVWNPLCWEEKPLGEMIEEGCTSALSDLDDVSLTTPTEGQILTFDGDDWVNADAPDVDVTKTASGNPIEVSDSANAPLVKCVSAITGSQDLHGYDKPWVGGAGKNKFDSALMVNPTTSAKWLQITLKANTEYTVSSDIPNSYTSAYIFAIAGTDTSSVTSGTNGVGLNRPQYITTGSDGIISFGYRTSGASGVLDLDDYVYQIEEGSTATSYEPYSNICPITAYDEGSVVVSKNILTMTAQPKTENGLTFTIDKNRIIINGTATAQTTLNVGTSTTVADKEYWFTGFPEGASSTTYFCTQHRTSTNRYADGYYTFTANSEPRIYVRSGVTCNNVVFDLRISEVEPTTHTTAYPSAIYRGSEDVVNGEVATEWVKYTLTANDIQNATYQTFNNFKALFVQTPVLNLPTPKTNGGIFSCFETKVGAGNPYGTAAVYSTGSIYFWNNDDYYADETAMKNALASLASNGDLQFAYEIATPTVTPVTPTNLPIKSLNGYSHIESSTGDMEIEYIAKAFSPITEIVDSQISALQKMMELMLTSARETTMTASANYTTGTLIVACGALYKATTAISSGASLVVGTNITPTTIAAELAALA